jgi:dTDP-4-amino-4,6-dideoxygalactose transaminase
MLEMQAVIGRIQLRRMAEWTRLRQANAATLAQALMPFASADGPVRLPQWACAGSPSCVREGGSNPSCVHAQYKFYAYVRPEHLASGWSRDKVIDAINEQGVPCYQGSCSEVYLEKAFDSSGWRPQDRLPVAKALGETTLMFLVHPTLTGDDMTRSVQAITGVLKAARR